MQRGLVRDDQAARRDRLSALDTVGTLTQTVLDEGKLSVGDEDELPADAAQRELLSEIVEGALPRGDGEWLRLPSDWSYSLS
jgi:hypothetical protein